MLLASPVADEVSRTRRVSKKGHATDDARAFLSELSADEVREQIRAFADSYKHDWQRWIDTASSAAPRLARARWLDELAEEATIDAYGESEERVGLLTMLEEHLAVPLRRIFSAHLPSRTYRSLTSAALSFAKTASGHRRPLWPSRRAEWRRTARWCGRAHIASAGGATSG